MKIYFSKVPHSDIDTFGDDGLLGPNEGGDFFYNQVEFGTNPGGVDEVAISDGCNRYIPICVDNIPELVAALTHCYNLKRVIDMGNNLTAVAESDTYGYVHEDHVDYDRESVQEAINTARY